MNALDLNYRQLQLNPYYATRAQTSKLSTPTPASNESAPKETSKPGDVTTQKSDQSKPETNVDEKTKGT